VRLEFGARRDSLLVAIKLDREPALFGWMGREGVVQENGELTCAAEPLRSSERLSVVRFDEALLSPHQIGVHSPRACLGSIRERSTLQAGNVGVDQA
jgi:hypothetical protein